MTGHLETEVDFKTMESAPRDGSHIQVTIPGHGKDNIVAWVFGFIDDNDDSVGSWAFMTEQEPPSCWSDGVMWLNNADGEKSIEPTQWKTITPEQGLEEISHIDQEQGRYD